jgi:two-component system sensor histidine kinase KdpD
MSYLGISKESIIMVFLLGVLLSSTMTSSFIWGILNSIASLMAFNYFFTEPRFTFVMTHSTDVILLVFFLITAIVSGTLTSRLQKQIVIAEKNERTSMILYQIASGFLPVSGEKNIVLQGLAFIEEFLGRQAVVRLDGTGAVYPGEISINISQTPSHTFPIQSAAGSLGVLQIYNAAEVMDKQNELIAKSIATQLGIALDREMLYNEQEHIKIAMEREQLRATLLRSVAHDLRSPLTALLGAGNLLADNYEKLSDEERKKLAHDLSEEILWLTNLVENILNMTRINESGLVLKKSGEIIDDVVSEAISHVERHINGRKFHVHLPEKVVMVPMDGKLIVQVLINLLENAIRHTPPDSEIALEVFEGRKVIKVVVSDTGDGIDSNIKDKLFDKFVTLDQGVIDGKRGIGLGLTICKAIVEAHGGTISAEANSPKGTRLVFTLPLEA